MVPPPDPLPRRRLLARLHAGLGRGVAVIHGEAGSGKSTLLRLLAGDRAVRVVAVSLDERAEDASFLIGTIGAAIGAHDVSASDARPASEKLARLLAAMAGAEPFVLALDDAHHLSASPPALRVLDRLARERPPGVGLVIVSRGPVRIHPLSEVTEITNDDLALSRDEASQLVFSLAPDARLSDEILDRLHAVTRGWLAAVALFASSLRGRDPTCLLDGMASAGGAVADYLGAQVLDLLGAKCVRHLECAAALEPFDADLLAQVTGEPCAETLQLAEAHHLIVEGPAGIYRFSGLVGDLLRGRLRQGVELWRSVQRRGGEVHAARGDLERTLHHVLGAGDTDQAVNLLVTVGYAALTTNRVRALGRYLDRLPAEAVDASLPLRFCRATVRMMRFEPAASIGDFQAVAAADGVPALAAAARARLAYFATWQGRFAEAARMARWALEVAAALPDGVAVYAHSFLEIALRHLGRDAEADAAAAALDAADLPFPASGIPPFGRGLACQLRGEYERQLAIALPWIERIEREQSTIGLASFHMLAAWAEAKLGRFAAALGRADRGIDLCEANEQAWWACNFRLIRLEALAGLERRDEVVREAPELLRVCRAHAMPWNEAEALLTLAPFAGDPDLALRQAWEAAARTEHPALRCQVRIEQARHALARGDATTARERLEAAARELGSVRAAEHRRAIALLEARAALAGGDRAAARARLREHLVPGPALRAARVQLVPLLLELAGDAELREPATAQILEAGVAALPALVDAGTPPARALVETILDDAAGPLHVHTLGALRVEREWRDPARMETVQFRSPQVADLLRLLLLFSRRGPVPREVLIDALWPDDDGSAAHNLHTHLSYLRRALEPHAPARAASRYVLREGDGYRLDLRGGSWDAALFEAEAEAGLAAIARGEHEHGEALLARTLSRYAGPLFAERPYLAPAAALRDRLERLMVEAALAYAARARERGEFRAAERHLERLLLEDGSVEAAYRLLMELAADQGRSDRVPGLLERCRRALRELLDAAPSRETEDTARRLMGESGRGHPQNLRWRPGGVRL
jgi:DNA-binding SARP family transcriptional activator